MFKLNRTLDIFNATDVAPITSSPFAANYLAPKLISPNGLLCIPKYSLWELPGAMPHVWLQQELVARLRKVDIYVSSKTNGGGRLIIWDGLRSLKTQTHLYETERKRIDLLHKDKTTEQRQAILDDIVRPPRVDRPPPHSTGGAVDLTISFDGTDSALGPFDDFTERGRSDYFSRTRVADLDDLLLATHRMLLRDSMLAEGFIGIASEWWHWEFGTRLWAEATNTTPLYDNILSAPETNSPALRSSHTPSRQPQHVIGIGQVFATPEERTLALCGENKGHYYARTRHPNEREVAIQLGAMISASDGVLFQSGLNAAVMTVWAHTPFRGRILLDKQTYYETINSIRQIALVHQWDIVLGDLSDEKVIAEYRGQAFDTIFVDHPRNWLLTCPRLQSLRQLSNDCGAKLIVDTSLQPLQRLLALGLADIVVISLSKYPSAGMTAGGVVFGSEKLLKPVDDIRRVLGQLLSPDSAARVLDCLPSLQDRIFAISQKSVRVVDALKKLAFVRDVRIPDLAHVGASPGGQITFLMDPNLAARSEKIIAANTLDRTFPLALACTFGASFTTFEHFDARNANGTKPSSGSEYIESGRIRIGIGNEDGDTIIERLRFVLLAAKNA